jgi:glyoxylase-like metal-dependent hydrolase (beta-lactamase superfamily II)
MAQTNISVDRLRELLERGEPVTVLDVRTAEDRAEWAIPGSVHLDAYDALKAGGPTALDGADLPRDRPVVTVCGMGRTAALATARLRARGYDARTLDGGMRAWSLAWNIAEVTVPGSAARVVQVRRTGKGCLSYLVGAAGQAAVIDAALDPRLYVDLARERGWTIASVLDTHLHADHLSRSRRLAELAGATLYLPAQARAAFPFSPLSDGDALPVGGARLAALATPGHTPESTTYLLDGRAAFTGDTLALAGVGRPDLAAGDDGGRARAAALHRSLRRLLALPPGTLVLPGHTGEPVAFDRRPVAATLAEVRARVPALALDEAAFVDQVLARIPPTPPNHARIVALNEAGEPFAGDPAELEAGANRCAVS